jgi:DNA-binding MarR family transcriptional regulator
MSIALDTALYIRENEVYYIDKNRKSHYLTASDRGYLFTLMFRVGSNPFTWISQEELAFEMGVTARPLKAALSKLFKLGLIVIEIDPQDRRKNRYRPADKLIDYHQKNRINTKKLTKQSVTQDKKYGLKTAPINPRKGLISAPTRCRKQPLLSKNNSLADGSVSEKTTDLKIPKEKVKQHKKQINSKNQEDDTMINLKQFKVNEAKKNDAQNPIYLNLAKQRFTENPEKSLSEHLKEIINTARELKHG